MNVIIANKYKDLLSNLKIEIIKSLEGVYDVDSIINEFSNFYFERMILDMSAIKDFDNLDNLQKLSINLDMDKVILLLEDSDKYASKAFLSKLISMGIYNFTRNLDGVNYLLSNPNTYRDVAHLHDVSSSMSATEEYYEKEFPTSIIIGLKNLTQDAGATTLSYMMKKNLEENYKVVAIEVNNTDYTFFDDKELISTNSNELPKELMKAREANVVLVDLNNYPDLSICNEVLCLVEPSILKLNKLMKVNSKVFKKYDNYKIVLTKSNINNTELPDFEYETSSKVFCNLPCLDERKPSHPEINLLLKKLGLTRGTDEKPNDSKILGMFKF